MTKVFIAPGDSYHAAIDMFERAGFEVVKDYQSVDLICFLGGTDVDPAVYGEDRHPATQTPDKQRDKIEVELYARFLNTPKVGICRGGQLLNVLNGGSMIQHLGKLVSGDVEVTLPTVEWDDPSKYRTVRVDHHQGILIHEVNGDLIAWCELDSVDVWPDYAGYYEDTKSLFFQPHPEWGHKGTEDYFFELIERYFGFVRKAT